MQNKTDLSKEIQEAIDVIVQYATEDWSDMGVNFYPHNEDEFIDTWITVNEDEYSIGFEPEDNLILKNIFFNMIQKQNVECNIVELEFDNDGNFSVSFE